MSGITDEEAIRRASMITWKALDARNLEDFMGPFVSDSAIITNMVRNGEKAFLESAIGSDQLSEMLVRHRQFEAGRHIDLNHVIDVDGTSADCRSSVLFYLGAGSLDLQYIADCHDEFVRVGQDWKLQRRTLDIVMIAQKLFDDIDVRKYVASEAS